MEIYNAIRNRRSVRSYSKYEMPQEDIKIILEAAMHAPSAKNTRPWEFVVLKSQDAKDKAMEIHPFSKHLKDASIAIIVCADVSNLETLKMGYFPQDCGAAIENILLQSLDLGYGSCWCGIYPDNERVTNFKKEFEIDSIPVALVIIGKAESIPNKKGYYEEGKVKFF